MMDFIFDYMESKGIYAINRAEQENIKKGISLYLLENGIDNEQTGEYYEQYISKRLDLINKDDLKNYFIGYSLMSDVIQIVMEYQADGMLPDKRVGELREKMKLLFDCSLGDKYVPSMEIRQILE